MLMDIIKQQLAEMTPQRYEGLPCKDRDRHSQGNYGDSACDIDDDNEHFLEMFERTTKQRSSRRMSGRCN